MGYLQLQIQQGLISPNATIDQSTVAWTPLNDSPLGPDGHQTTPKRPAVAVRLQQVTAADGHVIVGVAFTNRINDDAHISVEIRTAKLDVRTGQLTEPSDWRTPSPDVLPEYGVADADLPTSSRTPSLPTAASDNRFVRFVATGFGVADLAQSTVPFVDAQSVGSTPPVPLVGFGLFHKAQPGYGGYVYPRLTAMSVLDRRVKATG